MKDKWFSRTCVLLCVCALSPLSHADEKLLPSVESSLVVSNKGFFPVALRLQDGRIAVIFRGNRGHLGIDGRLDIVFSADEGKTWSAPTLVVDSPVDDRNPALGQAKDGTIVVGFYRTAQYEEDGRYNPKLDKPINTWVTRSSDGGKTWEEPAEIDVKDIRFGSPYGKILTFPDGAMLMAVYGGAVGHPEQAGNTSAPQRSYAYQSLDNGKTWKRYSEAIGGTKEQFSETSLLRLPSGKVLAVMRARATSLWEAESDDGGKTWSEGQMIAPANVHPADLLTLPNGRVLLTTGFRNTPFGVRGMLSDENFKFHWEDHFVLADDAVNSDCGYPSSVTLKDGRVLTVYYEAASKLHPEWRGHCAAVVYQPAPEAK